MHDRAEILAATDLRALADELLGPHVGGQRNPAWPCPNPQHAQTGRTPPVGVFLSHRGEQRWRCHGCGAGGTAIDLVIATRHTDVRGALDLLAARQHLEPDNETTWSSVDRRPPPSHPDPAGLARYVHECAQRLWMPAGRGVLRWFTDERGLDPAVLRANRAGADCGPRDQWRPSGMPRAAGAVIAAVDHDDTPTYVQLRLPRPREGQPRYLNPTSGLLPNPRVTHLRPVTVRRPEILVTEGSIDGLTAATAGYRAAAILAAGYPDEAIAAHLARLPGPLILAFDPDAAGTLGSQRLARLLDAHHRPARRLVTVGIDGDLNDQRRRVGDWMGRLDHLVDTAAPAVERSRDGPRHPGLDAA